MDELLAWIARGLVDDPAAVRVERVDEGDVVVLRLHCRAGRRRQGDRPPGARRAGAAHRRALGGRPGRPAARARDRGLARLGRRAACAIGRVGRPTGSTAPSWSRTRARTSGAGASARRCSSTASPPPWSSTRRVGGGRRAIRLDRPGRPRDRARVAPRRAAAARSRQLLRVPARRAAGRGGRRARARDGWWRCIRVSRTTTWSSTTGRSCR